MKITIDGEDNRIMLECKGDETLTFVPLRGDDSEIEYTVQALKDYCYKKEMAKIDLYDPKWVDMVFAGKNKEYGAYQLRKGTWPNVTSSLAV